MAGHDELDRALAAERAEHGGRDYDHLWTEHQHLVADLERVRRERSASARYAVELEDSLRRLYRACLAFAGITTAPLDHDQAFELSEALRLASDVLPSVRGDR